MMWWTGLKGWAKWQTGKTVPDGKAAQNVRICAECPLSELREASERDFTDEVAATLYKLGGAALLQCTVCGCPVGAEIRDPNESPNVVVGGRNVRALAKTQVCGEFCPKGLWRNDGDDVAI